MRVTRTVPSSLLLAAVTAALAVVPASADAATFKIPKARATEAAVPAIKVVAGEEVALKRSAAKRYARGQIRLFCTDVPDDLGAGSSSEGTITDLRKGVSLTFSTEYDYCIASVKRTRRNVTRVVSLGGVAITTEGDDYLYERGIAGLMSALSIAPLDRSEGGPPTVAEVIATTKGTTVSGRPLTGVATAGPRTEVPNDRIGIWTDGTRSSITATTPRGRHLYFDYDRSTRDLSSNIVPALTDDFGLEF